MHILSEPSTEFFIHFHPGDVCSGKVWLKMNKTDLTENRMTEGSTLEFPEAHLLTS